MTTLVVLVSLMLPILSGPQETGASVDEQPLRYRGIERLLAKFDAQND